MEQEGIVMNFVSNDFQYISDKNGSEFYNMFTSKAEAEERCKYFNNCNK